MWTWAKSPAHAEYLKGQATASYNREMRLATLGVPGVLARMGTSFLDPTMVPFVLATEGAAAPIIAAAKIGRMAKILSYGAAGAASGGAYDYMQMQENPTIDGWDVAASMGLGLVLGGAFGGLATKRATAEEARAIANLGEAQLNPGSSVGAAVNPNATGAGISDVNPELDPDYSAFSKARFSTVGASGGSKAGAARAVSRLYGEEATGLKGHGKVDVSASERMTMMFRKNMARYQQTMATSWDAYATDNKLGWWAKAYRGKEYRDYQRQIGELIENRDPADWDLAPQSVKDGAEVTRKIYEDFAKLANNPGLTEGDLRRSVRGFENVGPDPYYMPRWRS